MAPQQFLGGVYLAGDIENYYGDLTANNSKCVLTIPLNRPGRANNGFGPNGSILYQGSSQCAGIFELFLGTPVGIGANTGLYIGTFGIVKSPDTTLQLDPTLGTTVEWAGVYTQLYNIGGTDGDYCGNLNFCANLGPAYGFETFNGSGLGYLLELDGFTLNGSNQ
jgi:hypothetical protein